MLPSKSKFTDEQVQEVWDNIAAFVSESEAEAAVEAAVAETREVVRGAASRVVYGWSGGKDSVALRLVMERAGVRRCVLGLAGPVEFHSYLRWVRDNAPDGLTVFSNDTIDLELLARPEHHQYVFPRRSVPAFWWTIVSSRWAQLRYQELYEPELQIHGRRRVDDNKLGDGPYSISETQGMVHYSPIRDWSHELVLAVVRYFELELPPLYFQPYGWMCGTGGWPGRNYRGLSWQEAFYVTGQIELDRLRDAAPFFPDAAAALALHERGEG